MDLPFELDALSSSTPTSTSISTSTSSLSTPYDSPRSDSDSDSDYESESESDSDSYSKPGSVVIEEPTDDSILGLETLHGDGDNASENTAEDVDGDAAFIRRIERELQASVFSIEPVTHITYYLMFIDESRVLEVVESHVMKLSQSNIIDRYEVARIIKNARYRNSSQSHTPDYRLDAILIYNVDLTLNELIQNKHINESKSRFTTALRSLSNFTLRPTMACFHCQNSIHIILSRRPFEYNPANPAGDKRYVSIQRSALTRRRRPETH
jgi:hypothetical protein